MSRTGREQTCHRGCGIDVSSTEDVGQTCRVQRMWDRRVEYRGCGTDVSSTDDMFVHQ